MPHNGTIPRGTPMSRRRFVELSGVSLVGFGVTANPVKGAVSEERAQTGQLVEKRENVEVEMRDGRILRADVYLPPQANQRGGIETLVTRTPYNKAGYGGTAEYFAQRGYAVVVQDVRGKFESDGDFYPYRSEGNAEAADGYDTIEWAAEQEFSNGIVGTFGISYLAGTQWAIVHNDELPPHLEAMAPGYAVSSYYGQGSYAGGACLLSHNIDYLNGFGVERFNRDNPNQADNFTVLDEAQEAMMQVYWDLPVHPYEPFEEVGLDWLTDWHTNETYNEYWEAQDHTLHYDKVDIPVLNYGGWYDIFTQGPVTNYQGLAEEGVSDEMELVMGPYTHGAESVRAQGQVTGSAYYFPENAAYDELATVVAFFDRHLKGRAQQVESLPSVRFYVPGLDEWVGAEEFPLPETEFTNYYLNSDGDANADAAATDEPTYNGELSTNDSRSDPTDEYTYDPSDPVVAQGGYNSHWHGGVTDRATAYHGREDILVYQTDVLSEDVAIVGPITVTLFAETSAVDTDFIVHLSDVTPGARTGGLWVAEGARRGRIGDVEADPRALESYSDVSLLTPGEVYEWKIAVWPTARVFEEGHRIRIDVTSSDFPRYDRNLNTGEGLDDDEMETAEQTIYHDDVYPSRVELPIVPMEGLEERTIDSPVPGRQGRGR
ncbi:CocE/NonD family hydrolase [Halorarum salinum]|uniref:CocE/NonD family hydrolase n=1 Tax=Halorarum salinum TaxID=2743089 RepID=UPI001C529892|nr:CocE/NonD family hydrolase [Halobaculum salinum]